MVVVTVCAVAPRRTPRLAAARRRSPGSAAISRPFLLSTGEDQALSLFVYLLLLGAGAVWLDRRRPWPETLPLALAGTSVLYAGWYLRHFRPERFEVAAVGLVALTALLALSASAARRRPAGLLPGVVLVGGGIGAAGLAGTDRPLPLLALLTAQAAIAVLVARRWRWAEALSASLAFVAVLVWHDQHFAPERAADTLALALTISGLYFLITSGRGLLLGERLRSAGVATHLVVAALAWLETDRVLGVTAPQLRGAAALALAAVHLVVGLASRRRADLLRARVTLALAVSFLTIAIPVQLGLHGTTLAWVLEALVLVWLGVRQGSPLTRGFGYGVLLLAVVRLLVRHLPLHAGTFVPVLNPELGVWLAVVASLAVAHVMTRRLARPASRPDAAAGVLLVPLALGLLLVVLTMETQASFDQRARVAAAAGDEAVALGADHLGDLSVSVLWTVFATGLLAAGLGLRSRGLFYAAYALFATTAGKVVLFDLATLSTLYRMLAFLALGVLLLAGAWLNLRFRARLMGPRAAA